MTSSDSDRDKYRMSTCERGLHSACAQVGDSVVPGEGNKNQRFFPQQTTDTSLAICGQGQEQAG